MHPLTALGWTEDRAAQLAALDRTDLVPARVAAAHRGRLDLLAAAGPLAGRISGRLRHAATRQADLPGRRRLGRRRSGERRRARGAAAPRRHLARRPGRPRRGAGARRQRRRRAAARVAEPRPQHPPPGALLTLAADARAEAVVVLSKADLVPDPWEQVADVRLALGATVPVVAISTHAGTGLDALGAWLRPGATAVLLGSSGVGKTTLLNALGDGPPRRTAEIRAERRPRAPRDDRPRARAARLRRRRDRHARAAAAARLGAGGGLETAFGDVAELAARCRFADCSHNGEPGCAIAAAVEDGTLAPRPLRGAAQARARARAHRVAPRRPAHAPRRAAPRAAMQRALRARLKEKGR